MPQVAQQDYIRLAVADPTALTAEEKAHIKKHVQQGTIWDVLVEIEHSPVSCFGRQRVQRGY